MFFEKMEGTLGETFKNPETEKKKTSERKRYTEVKRKASSDAGSYLIRNSYRKYPALPLQETHMHMLI